MKIFKFYFLAMLLLPMCIRAMNIEDDFFNDEDSCLKDSDCERSIVVASRKGYIEIVNLLLEEESIDIDIKDELGDTALTAIFSDSLLNLKGEMTCKQLVLALLRAGANPTIKNDQLQKNAIQLARENGFVELGKLMDDFWNESMPESD